MSAKDFIKSLDEDPRPEGHFVRNVAHAYPWTYRDDRFFLGLDHGRVYLSAGILGVTRPTEIMRRVIRKLKAEEVCINPGGGFDDAVKELGLEYYKASGVARYYRVPQALREGKAKDFIKGLGRMHWKRVHDQMWRGYNVAAVPGSGPVVTILRRANGAWVIAGDAYTLYNDADSAKKAWEHQYFDPYDQLVKAAGRVPRALPEGRARDFIMALPGHKPRMFLFFYSSDTGFRHDGVYARNKKEANKLFWEKHALDAPNQRPRNVYKINDIDDYPKMEEPPIRWEHPKQEAKDFIKKVGLKHLPGLYVQAMCQTWLVNRDGDVLQYWEDKDRVNRSLRAGYTGSFLPLIDAARFNVREYVERTGDLPRGQQIKIHQISRWGPDGTYFPSQDETMARFR
jgi:hypothetical protein